MNGMCVKNNTITYVVRASNKKRDCDAWSLLLLTATVRSFAHMPLRISDCYTTNNTVVMTQGAMCKTDCLSEVDSQTQGAFIKLNVEMLWWA